MRVLIACERTAITRDAFLARGHDAWSCDLEPTEGGSWRHLRADAREIARAPLGWDLMIAFPPCTHLSGAGHAHWSRPGFDALQRDAHQLVRDLHDAPIPRVAIENPVGWLNSHWRRPDQITQPFHYGEPWRKTTCLWLRGLPPLRPTRVVEPLGSWVAGGGRRSRGRPSDLERERYPRSTRARTRSRGWLGIARAMADQWGSLDINNRED